MIAILGKKRWEALPMHGKEERWYIHITVNYGSYTVLYHEINACLVESICQIREEFKLKDHFSIQANMAGELKALWFAYFEHNMES